MKRRRKFGFVILLAGCLWLAACQGKTDAEGEVATDSVRELFGEPLQGTAQGATAQEEPLKESQATSQPVSESSEEPEPEPTPAPTQEPEMLLASEGMTLDTRVKTPSGYERVAVSDDSFEQYLRQYPVKEADAKIHLYDGTEKLYQYGHAAVLDLPIEAYDLQQCADSVMRMYAEYFWNSGQKDRIAFHFTNGFLAEYSKWRDGMRIQVNGNNVSWVSEKGYDDSYACFVQYLKIVFCYAGTISMSTEAKTITMDELRPGDVFLCGGSPGHVVLVMDVCENAEGKKAFLLAQGHMPAQEFHLIRNILHFDTDPWFYEEEIQYPFEVAGYSFPEGSLKRLNY